MDNLPHDILIEIFVCLSSKSRSEICTVSSQWNKYGVEASKRLSKFPESYDTGTLEGIYVNDIIFSGDYHLYVRCRSSMTHTSRIEAQVNYHFRLASYTSHVDFIHLMIAHGADDFGGAMAMACTAGNIETATLLKTLGDGDWNCALMEAGFYGHLEAVKLMISYGAKDIDRCLAFADAVGHPEIVELLKSHGADIRRATD